MIFVKKVRCVTTVTVQQFNFYNRVITPSITQYIVDLTAQLISFSQDFLVIIWPWNNSMADMKNSLTVGICCHVKLQHILCSIDSFANKHRGWFGCIKQQQPFYSPLYGTTRVSQYQKKHPTTHHPDHHPVYQLLPSTVIHSVLPVQITCLAIFLHNLCPRPLWSTFGLKPSTSRCQLLRW